MIIDEKIAELFQGKIRQVFVYLTSRCQLRCRQCLYKPLLQNECDDIPFDTLSDLLSQFREYGAFKLSFLGGEPTLYHDPKTDRHFSDIVVEGKGMGYSFIRADTNGQFDGSLLTDSKVRCLDELTFSIDGSTAEIHDRIRGRKGAFDRCISRIKQAVQLGYRVQITTCFHNGICHNTEEGIRHIEDMIHLCDTLGVQSLNFHPILKVGAARDNWIDDTEVNPLVWIDIYQKMMEKLPGMDHRVKVRMPQRYIEEDRFTAKNAYCPLRMGERVLIMPNGDLKVCAFNIGTPYRIGGYDMSCVKFEEEHSELNQLKQVESGCCNQLSPKGFRPLCMSYKPNQQEIVWDDLKESGVV